MIKNKILDQINKNAQMNNQKIYPWNDDPSTQGRSNTYTANLPESMRIRSQSKADSLDKNRVAIVNPNGGFLI